MLKRIAAAVLVLALLALPAASKPVYPNNGKVILRNPTRGVADLWVTLEDPTDLVVTWTYIGELSKKKQTLKGWPRLVPATVGFDADFDGSMDAWATIELNGEKKFTLWLE